MLKELFQAKKKHETCSEARVEMQLQLSCVTNCTVVDHMFGSTFVFYTNRRANKLLVGYNGSRSTNPVGMVAAVW